MHCITKILLIAGKYSFLKVQSLTERLIKNLVFSYFNRCTFRDLINYAYSFMLAQNILTQWINLFGHFFTDQNMHNRNQNILDEQIESSWDCVISQPYGTTHNGRFSHQFLKLIDTSLIDAYSVIECFCN